MPKKAKELTAKAVAALKEQGRHAVGGVAGLCLQISSGSRSWILRIVVEGKRCELGLGPYPEVTLAMARDAAIDRRRARYALSVPRHPLIGLASRGPAQSRGVGSQLPTAAPPSAIQTFAACAKRYIDAQAPSWKSGKHAKQWTSTLQRYAFPTIGSLAVAVITTDDVVKILQPIWTEKTETATRVRGRIESVLDYATHKGYRAGKNPATWEGNLEHELPSPTKLKQRKVRHHPALPYTRLGAFMVDLRARSRPPGWCTRDLLIRAF